MDFLLFVTKRFLIDIGESLLIVQRGWNWSEESCVLDLDFQLISCVSAYGALFVIFQSPQLEKDCCPIDLIGLL